MKNPRHSLTLPLLAALGLALTPAPARANMILPAVVFIFSWLHLLIGNLIIGVAEGWLIGRIFKVKYSAAIPVMIAANYFSGWAGYCVVEVWRGAYNLALIDHFDHIRALLWGAWVALFAGTLALEWPFCFWIFRKAERRWHKSGLALLYSQGASYAVLLALYFLFSDMSLVTETKYERSLDFVKDKKAWVYYLSPEGDAIWRRRLDGSAPQKMMETGLHEGYMELWICSGEQGKGKDVWLDCYKHHKENMRLMLRNLTEPVMAAGESKVDPMQIRERRISLYVRPKDADALSISNLDHSDQALGIWRIRHDAAGEHWEMVNSLCLQTPMAVWRVWNFGDLAGDQAVIQMGNDPTRSLITVLDAHTLQQGVIARGCGPAVAYE